MEIRIDENNTVNESVENEYVYYTEEVKNTPQADANVRNGNGMFWSVVSLIIGIISIASGFLLSFISITGLIIGAIESKKHRNGVAAFAVALNTLAIIMFVLTVIYTVMARCMTGA